MVAAELERYIKLAPLVLAAPGRYLWSSYDAEADVLYINFKNRARPPTANSLPTMSSSATKTRKLSA